MRPLVLPMLAISLLSAAPAAAQDMQLMHMQARNMAGKEPQGDPVVTHDFAVCIAGDGGAGILERLPHTDDETDLVFWTSRIGGTSCHPNTRRLVVGARFMRGGAAEYLLERPGGPLRRAVFAMPSNEELQALSPEARSAVVFIQIGECAARANPGGVMALLATQVASPEEREAFAGVVPSIGACLPAGVSFGIPRLLARAYLAEGAYRNAVAERAGQN